MNEKGVHAFFGAFIAGLCVPRAGQLVEFLSLRIGLIIVEFFLPYNLIFTYFVTLYHVRLFYF